MTRSEGTLESRQLSLGERLPSEPGETTRGAPSWDERKPALAQGQTFGRYVILKAIGSGGMGVVYAAYDPELDRRVALKLLHGELPGDEDHHRTRMLREAQTLAKISDPNVITVFDVGTVDGRVFIAMELVVGVDLRTYLATRKPPWKTVLGLLVQAGRGLAAAHRVGLVHRDFKPANVLVGDDGIVRVVDFGVARRLGRADDSAPLSQGGDVLSDVDDRLTRTGTVVGTPAYMSPEQHEGREIDALSDQFSFCITAYEALYGQRPFAGGSLMALRMQASRGDVVLPRSAVPASVGRAIVKGLAPKPGDRHASMATLLDRLEHDPRAARRRTVAAGVAVVALAGFGWVASTRRPEPPCRGAASLVATAYGPEHARSIETAFDASSRPYARATLAYATRVLEGYADAWVRAHTDACEATRVRGTQSEELFDRRMLCLERRRSELEALVRILSTADDDTIEHTANAVASLPALDRCSDTEALLNSAAPPRSEDERRAAAELEALIARGRAERNAARFEDALATAELALDHAERLGDPSLQAKAMLQLAFAQNHSNDRQNALASTHRAAQLATRAGDDELLMGAWIELVYQLAINHGAYDEALRWVAYARALLERIGPDHDFESDLLRAESTVEFQRGNYEATERLLARCDAVFAAWGREVPIPFELQRGNTYVMLHRYDEAGVVLDRVLARALETRGPDHPMLGMIRNARGVAAFHTGDLATAEREYTEAYAIIERAYGPEAPDILYSLGNLGEIQRLRGHHDAAFETMSRVMTLVERNFPPVHPEVGITKHNLATILRERGEAEQALPLYAEALRVREQVHGADHAYVANTLTGQGLALLELGRVPEAIAPLERALSIREADHDETRYGAETRFALARALAATGRDPARARSLAEAALAMVPSTSATETLHGEIVAWLASTPAP